MIPIDPDGAIVREAARRRRSVRRILAEVAELLDAHPFGDRAMAARERLARLAKRIKLYPCASDDHDQEDELE